MDTILSKIADLFSYDPASPMIFSSGSFFFAFIFFVIIYAAIHKNRIAVSLYVIAFSLFFYYLSSGVYFLILVITSVTDYGFAIVIDRAAKQGWKRFWLMFAVWLSLCVLFFFKYTNFFIENFTNIVKWLGDFPGFVKFLQSFNEPIFKSFSEIAANNFQPLDIFLPIGISFFTFQSISYVIDVYKKTIPPARNVLDYAFFLSFFPQLVAGPIVKANLFLPQMRKPIEIKKEWVWAGFWLIIIGLFKKAVIADYISQYNDFVFAAPHTYSGFENLMAILGYALQIYGDFSGYSDMAIGLGLIMGFDLGINFNFPYKSLNITDFWRRWHISLSSWLRDYLYIGLGGNRKGKWKTYRNLFLTMFLGGLWHGANWKFVVWGSAHGVGLAVHKALKGSLDKIADTKATKFFAWLLTFLFVITLWVFFRAVDVSEAYSDHTIVGGAKYTYKSQTETLNDSVKIVRIQMLDSVGILKENIIDTLIAYHADKIKLSYKISGNDMQLTVNADINAYKVSLMMIKRVIFELEAVKYAPEFWRQHKLWVILMLIGFFMHLAPQRWTDGVKNRFVSSNYFIKLLVFIVLLQIVIQFKSENVVPFIYFQF